MLFNSIEFIIFLSVVFIIYWFFLNKHLWLQNSFILVVSYIFYGWWDCRFLFLIFISSLVDYFCGLLIYKYRETKIKKNFFLIFSLFFNLSLLGFFKYYNFFIESFIEFSSLIGFKASPATLKLILPVGISFYTFQTLSYTIDVYRERIFPTKDIIAFLAFVSFFPQLVAGPVERAVNLLPQFKSVRNFDIKQAKDGLRQMLWGLFKKIVIADICALYVSEIFNNYNLYYSGTLILGIIYFAFQIYCDFSGYSDIAIGTAKLFGFRLMQNFAYPYFSRDIIEYWRRWHISLSTWFRDYLYIPLGGSRGSKFIQIRNIIITFTISGLWHGANWTFIIWGFLNGLLFIPNIIIGKSARTEVAAQDTIFPTLKELAQIISTFTAINLTCVFFRSATVYDAINYLTRLFTTDLIFDEKILSLHAFIWIIILLFMEWVQRKKEHALQINQLSRFLRWIIYYILGTAVFYYFFSNFGQSFVYFQF